jgi:hypothetical protein
VKLVDAVVRKTGQHAAPAPPTAKRARSSSLQDENELEPEDGGVDEAGEEKDDGEEIGQNVAEKQVEEEAEKSEQNDQTEENDQSEEEDRCADLLKERETNSEGFDYCSLEVD